MEASADGVSRWCRLEIVVRGDGSLSWWCDVLEVAWGARVTWWRFELVVVGGGGGISHCCDVVET